MKKILLPHIALLALLVACATNDVKYLEQLNSTFNKVHTYVTTVGPTPEAKHLLECYPPVHENAVRLLSQWRETGRKPAGIDHVMERLKDIDAYVTAAINRYNR